MLSVTIALTWHLVHVLIKHKAQIVRFKLANVHLNVLFLYRDIVKQPKSGTIEFLHVYTVVE